MIRGAEFRQPPIDVGATVTVSTKKCGMLRIGDGFGIHLNKKPDPFHLAMMGYFFGWTWVPDLEGLTND